LNVTKESRAERGGKSDGCLCRKELRAQRAGQTNDAEGDHYAEHRKYS
jgi:hypothetical protein